LKGRPWLEKRHLSISKGIRESTLSPGSRGRACSCGGSFEDHRKCMQYMGGYNVAQQVEEETEDRSKEELNNIM
jgi:hypothetical protein